MHFISYSIKEKTGCNEYTTVQTIYNLFVNVNSVCLVAYLLYIKIFNALRALRERKKERGRIELYAVFLASIAIGHV